MSRWRLDSVEINGFRGVAGKRHFDFLGKNGLLFGPNGQGKSTVPLAIQWGLFGKFPTGILQNTKFSSFLGSWVKGEGADSVRLAFQRDGRRLVVSRADGSSAKVFRSRWTARPTRMRRRRKNATNCSAWTSIPSRV